MFAYSPFAFAPFADIEVHSSVGSAAGVGAASADGQFTTAAGVGSAVAVGAWTLAVPAAAIGLGDAGAIGESTISDVVGAILTDRDVEFIYTAELSPRFLIDRS
jgi:hypothetical protein